ncbi:MAG: bifunctional UDP-N-acetylmuramoyl-tripeptide:D-alanyl-D-alanine ligase/alanine racemase [Mangrovibacterium sp.]
MHTLELVEAAAAFGGSFIAGGEQAPPGKVCSVAIDSRRIVEVQNCLFFAIKGRRHDGHRYLPDLYNRGVRMFVVSEPDINQKVFPGACMLLVTDTLLALQQLAAFVRRKFTYPVLGITGSNGKTMVKEWLYSLLQEDLRIIRSPKSFNSQVGVPLSVWNMDDCYELGIFEAGISQPGEMERLADIIVPETGLITNIGDAHQENFVSVEQKALEKLKLFRSCRLLIYCRDQRLTDTCVRSAFSAKSLRLFSWSVSNPEADLLIKLSRGKKETRLTFRLDNREEQLVVPFTDEASLENICHCLAFLVANGYWTGLTAGRFRELQPVAMRLELKQGINNCLLVNDYYNSDIHSLEIALQFLRQQSVEERQCLILSDIRQSGLEGRALARELSRLAGLYGIDRLICIGRELGRSRNVFRPGTVFYDSTEAFVRQFDSSLFRDEQILLKGAREFHFERIAALLQKKYHQTQLEIDLAALVGNLNRYKALLKPDTRVMVMVKAFSYGSGTVEIARALEFQQVDYLAVAVADEGIELRQAGVETPVIVMNPEEHSFEMMLEYGLEPNLYSREVYERFDRVARSMAVSHYPVHLKLETGMNRLGFSSRKEVQEVARQIAAEGRLYIRSVFSHLAVSDDPAQDDFTRSQYERFCWLSETVVGSRSCPVFRHLLNSAGIERFPEYQMEMVRLGIGLYGLAQSAAVQTETVARWTTVVSQVKELGPGETVGYGRKGRMKTPGKIAVIPVGYADGYDRRLGNGRGKVWLNGRYCPVIGNVCMDMSMIDVSRLEVRPGDTVELMGDRIPLIRLAEWMETIPYEVLTGISQRVRRVYIQE